MAAPSAPSVSDPIPPDQMRGLVKHEPRHRPTKSALEGAADLCEELIGGAPPSPVRELRWGWPGSARKAHVFAVGGSLCGRWMWLGRTTDLGELGDKPGPDDCVPCWRKAKEASHGRT
jgi:hypothetical protein